MHVITIVPLGAVDRRARHLGVQAELLREHGADTVRGERGGVPVGGEERRRGGGRSERLARNPR